MTKQHMCALTGMPAAVQEWAALSRDCCLWWKTGAQAMLSSSPITKATSRTLR